MEPEPKAEEFVRFVLSRKVEREEQLARDSQDGGRSPSGSRSPSGRGGLTKVKGGEFVWILGNQKSADYESFARKATQAAKSRNETPESESLLFRRFFREKMLRSTVGASDSAVAVREFLGIFAKLSLVSFGWKKNRVRSILSTPGMVTPDSDPEWNLFHFVASLKGMVTDVNRTTRRAKKRRGRAKRRAAGGRRETGRRQRRRGVEDEVEVEVGAEAEAEGERAETVAPPEDLEAEGEGELAETVAPAEAAEVPEVEVAAAAADVAVVEASPKRKRQRDSDEDEPEQQTKTTPAKPKTPADSPTRRRRTPGSSPNRRRRTPGSSGSRRKKPPTATAPAVASVYGQLLSQLKKKRRRRRKKSPAPKKKQPVPEVPKEIPEKQEPPAVAEEVAADPFQTEEILDEDVNVDVTSSIRVVRVPAPEEETGEVAKDPDGFASMQSELEQLFGEFPSGETAGAGPMVVARDTIPDQEDSDTEDVLDIEPVVVDADPVVRGVLHVLKDTPRPDSPPEVVSEDEGEVVEEPEFVLGGVSSPRRRRRRGRGMRAPGKHVDVQIEKTLRKHQVTSPLALFQKLRLRLMKPGPTTDFYRFRAGAFDGLDISEIRDVLAVYTRPSLDLSEALLKRSDDPAALGCLKSLAVSGSSLRAMILARNGITDEAFRDSVYPALVRRAVMLDLTGNKIVTFGGANQRNVRLQHLRIGSNLLNGEGMRLILDRLINLKELEIEDNPLDARAVVYLAEFLQRSKGLKALNFSKNFSRFPRRKASELVSVFFRALADNRTLESLVLEDTPMTLAQVRAIALYLRNNSGGLLMLNLAGCRLAGAKLKTLLNAMGANKHIRGLHLCKNGLTDADMAEIVSMLERKDDFVELCLSENQFTDDAMSSLLECAPQMQKMEELDLTLNPFANRAEWHRQFEEAGVSVRILED